MDELKDIRRLVLQVTPAMETRQIRRKARLDNKLTDAQRLMVEILYRECLEEL